MDNDKRFIEDTFPVKEVSAESTREKNIRHGHISTLHIWWARRPLASSRATSYAALIPAVSREENPDEWTQKRDFISKFSKWENSLNQTMIDKARKEILEANDGKPPKVLDPFAGGGAIPLEALRLGCETYASDYNPVAVLIEKCTLEYPQKYGKPGEIEEEVEEFGRKRKIKIKVENKLLEDVKKWGNWVLDETKKEIGKFYPPDEDGSIPVGYIWARTIPCQNPRCKAEIPLMRQYWLAKKPKKKVSLYPYVNGTEVIFKIVGDGYERVPEGFDPAAGTVSRAVATCPNCGAVTDAQTTRKLFRERKAGQRMVAVVLRKPGASGKRYRTTTDNDMQIFREAEECLKEKREKLMLEWGMDPVPDEQMNMEDPTTVAGRGYGFTKWGDLFNPRQKISLVTFVEKVREAFNSIAKRRPEDEFPEAIMSYLGLAVDRLSFYCNNLATWVPRGEYMGNVASMQAISMTFDFAEVSPISQSTGDWNSALGWILRVIDHCSNVKGVQSPVPVITQNSATSLPYPDNYFDAVFTDPPYYDNVNYAELSDFFYVWLKRTIGNLHPSLFSTPLVPKSNEIVANPIRHGGNEKAKDFFESNLKRALKETNRVLKPGGIGIIVYAHKSTEGWETVINSLLESGLVISAAWPINTEMQESFAAEGTASLMSSIYLIARKMKRQPTGFYNSVQEELQTHINDKLETLWQEGIAGADFFIAAIGSGIEIFGKYEKVIDYEGNTVRADRLLEDVRKIATDYAVRQILHNGFGGEISDLTKFYVLWRWNYGSAKVQFDEANKLARSCGIDLAREWNRPGFIKKEKEFIKLLGPQDRKLDQLTDSTELIDILHEVLLLWEKSKRDEIKNTLGESGYGTSEAFYRVAQAISETLPIENKEKKLLDGFLAGKERIKDEIKQGRLFK